MAKDLYSAKVDTEVKNLLGELTDKYMDKGLIMEKGDLLVLASSLLERNLSVQTPRHVAGIDELDQLTSRINRLFSGMIEQNNTLVTTMQFEHDEKFEKSKIKIDGLLEEKQELKEQLTAVNTEIVGLTELTKVNQDEINKLTSDVADKGKLIALLEGQIEVKDAENKKLNHFEEENKELALHNEQKDKEIKELMERIAQMEAAAQQQTQEHANNVREMKLEKKESLLELEKELNGKYNEELAAVRKQRDEFFEKNEERLAMMQEKLDVQKMETEQKEKKSKK